MKNLFTLVIAVLFSGLAFGQVYIDTGHPDIEKKKGESEVRPMDSELKITEDGEAETIEEIQKESEKSTMETETKESTQSTATQTKTSTQTETKAQTKTVTEEDTKSTSTAPVVIDAEMIELEQTLPKNAEPGKCYARCYIPNQYRYVEEKVIDQEKSYKEQVIPAVYKTVYDTVLVREEKRNTKTVAATYEYVQEKIMVAPSTTKWVKGEADANCLSADPKDCQVLCLVETPAQYKTVNRKVVKTPEYTYEEVVPAEYKVVTRKELEKEETVVKIEVPATYKTIMKKELSKKGGYQDWREVLCQDQLTTDRIKQIQRALKENGYNPGPIDNIFGQQTKDALLQYQIDNELPQGNLNMETLQALGVE
jgi:hypothetical protein